MSSTTSRSARRAPAALAALTLFTSVSAWAGPRVGSVIGVPSQSSSTVDARVLSSTPVVAQVAVPQETCYDELRAEAPRSSGAGAIIGAIAGAALGNAVGKGSGRALATGVGLIGGAALGNHVETDGREGRTRTVRRCAQQTAYENQVVAYNVTYEVNGQRYTTQMDHEPGRTIPVQLTVSPAVSRVSTAAPLPYDEEDGYYYQDQVGRAPPAVVVQSYYQRSDDRHGPRWERWRGDGHHQHHPRGWRD